MRFALPLNMKDAEEKLLLPTTIYKSRNGFEIIIDKFTITEKQEMFGIKFIGQTGASFTYNQNKSV
ncbi:MAG: hypothetical protein V1763_02100, partial [Parcubacteria group bacterium]